MGLVEPAPAVLRIAVAVALQDFRLVAVRLGIDLAGVDVDADAGVVLAGVFEEYGEILQPAGALVVVAAVVGVGAVVTFRREALDDDLLAECRRWPDSIS